MYRYYRVEQGSLGFGGATLIILFRFRDALPCAELLEPGLGVQEVAPEPTPSCAYCRLAVISELYQKGGAL